MAATRSRRRDPKCRAGWVASTSQGQRAAAQVAAVGCGVRRCSAAERDRQFGRPDFDEARRTKAELRRRSEMPVLGSCVPRGRIDGHHDAMVRACGFTVAFRWHRTEQGGMCRDGTVTVAAMLFAGVWQRSGSILLGSGPCVVTGVVEARLGGVGLRVVAVAQAGGR